MVWAQGCSDAGFCSLGDLKRQSDEVDSLKNNTIAFGIGYSRGLEDTQYANGYLEYSRKCGEKISFQAKLTAAYATGFAGENFNIGDVFLFGTYRFIRNSTHNLSFLAGAKIPLNYSNNTNSKGVALPLDYQSSIGTYDFIAGLNLSLNKHWEFNVGYQVPIINKNQSSFFPSLYADERINEFAPTNQYRRKSDGLVRAGYVFNFKESSWKFKPNLLAIYHFGNDTYEDINDKTISIKNSEGLTLNGGLVTTYFLRNRNQLEFIVAAPLIVREVRPDGLTRSIVLNVQYKIMF